MGGRLGSVLHTGTVMIRNASRRSRATADPKPAPRAVVDDLVAQATAAKRRDYLRLKSLAEQAFELSCQQDEGGNQYLVGMASALALLAHVSSVQGDAESTLQQVSQALSLLDSSEPSVLLGDLYLTRGCARLLAGEYIEALDDLGSAQQIAEEIGDRSLAAFVLDRIARVCHATERVPLALDLQQRALAIHRELGDDTGEALVLNNMSYTLLDLGRDDEALDSAASALRWAETEDSLYLLMAVLDTVAEVYRRRGELDKAAESSARGFELALEHSSEPDRGDALFTMARIALQRERYDEAFEAATEALAIAEKHHRAIEEFTCHELLSSIQESRGEIVSALAHCREYHALERKRMNEETARRLASLQVEHEVDAAKKDAEIHRLRSLALEREVEQGRIVHTQLEAQASLDPLSGLFNRRHLSVLSEDFERALAHGRHGSVVLVDIDHFKEINDTYGHFAGDCALMAIARLLRDNARDSDTPLRYGGDEFLVLLGGSGAVESRAIAERVRDAVATHYVEHRGYSIPLTVSIGVASARPGEETGLLALVERADRALYEAKRSGRDCVVFEEAMGPLSDM